MSGFIFQTRFKLLSELKTSLQEWEAITHQIINSKNSVFVSTFFIEPDFYGYEFLKLMTEASQRGVKCVILTDQTGQRLAGYKHKKPHDPLLKKAWEEFKNAGGVHVLTKPESFFANTLSKIVMGGNHFKFFIFDGSCAIITGRNIGASSFETWADYGVLLEGPILSNLLTSFDDLLKINQAQNYVGTHFLKLPQSNENDSVEEVTYLDFDPIHHGGCLNPFSKKENNLITHFLSSKILEARSEILITSFMFKPTSILLEAVLKAAKKGVKIKLITSGINALPEGKVAYWAAACGYEKLQKAGIEIYETFIPEHSKLIAIDETWAGFGSYNFEYAAHDRLREGMVMSQNTNFISRIRKILEERYMPHLSQPVHFKKENLKKRLGYSLMRPLRWFF